MRVYMGQEEKQGGEPAASLKIIMNGNLCNAV